MNSITMKYASISTLLLLCISCSVQNQEAEEAESNTFDADSHCSKNVGA